MGTFSPESPIFDGKNPWVSGVDFPLNQSIDDGVGMVGNFHLQAQPRPRACAASAFVACPWCRRWVPSGWRQCLNNDVLYKKWDKQMVNHGEHLVNCGWWLWIMVNEWETNRQYIGWIMDESWMYPTRWSPSLLAKLVNTVNTTPIPSGKPTKNYGKSQFLMGTSTINRHFQ